MPGGYDAAAGGASTAPGSSSVRCVRIVSSTAIHNIPAAPLGSANPSTQASDETTNKATGAPAGERGCRGRAAEDQTCAGNDHPGGKTRRNRQDPIGNHDGRALGNARKQRIEMTLPRADDEPARCKKHLSEEDHPETGVEFGRIEPHRHQTENGDRRHRHDRVARLYADDGQVSERVDSWAAHHGRTSETCPAPESTMARSPSARRIKRADSCSPTSPSGAPSRE